MVKKQKIAKTLSLLSNDQKSIWSNDLAFFEKFNARLIKIINLLINISHISEKWKMDFIAVIKQKFHSII